MRSAHETGWSPGRGLATLRAMHDDTLPQPGAAEAALREAALDYHRLPVRGKVAVSPTKPLANQRDLSLAYSPGVAYPCLEIEKDPTRAADYTARGNLVGVVTNGTAGRDVIVGTDGPDTINALGGSARATADMRVDFHRPATSGPLRAIGKVVKLGKQLSVAETRIEDVEGKLIASGRGAYVG